MLAPEMDRFSGCNFRGRERTLRRMAKRERERERGRKSGILESGISDISEILPLANRFSNEREPRKGLTYVSAGVTSVL